MVRSIVIFVLAVVVLQPVYSVYFDLADEDIEMLEKMGEEDAEEEFDDLEEKSKLFQDLDQYLFEEQLANVSFSHYYNQLKTQYSQGVNSPPPEFTI
ncbi:MAG: hypothetical protein R2780_06845 [Crocinitomicaceae bacterium]|nr:hypothetical protein [Crocinitomicaceae bacterium]